MPRTPPWGQDTDYPPRLFLAVDCGGTSSKASISDKDGVILGKGIGGPCNFTDVPQATFLQSVTTAVQMALKNAGVRNHHLDRLERNLSTGQIGGAENGDSGNHGHSRSSSSANPTATSTTTTNTTTSLNRNSSISSTHSTSSTSTKLIPLPPRIQLFTSAWFGIAGVDSALDVSHVSPLLAQLLNLPFPSTRLIVANDTSLLASPIHDPISVPRVKTGVVLIAGTGSIVVSFRKAKNGMLRTVGRVGGFGWLLGDEGSGYSVGRNALRAVLDQADRERLVAGDDEFEHDQLELQEELKEELQEEEFLKKKQGGEEEEEEEESRNDTHSEGSLKMEEAQSSWKSSSRRQFGHLLRDRILEEWGLVSTDDLLNAVYSSRTPSLSTRVEAAVDQNQNQNQVINPSENHLHHHLPSSKQQNDSHSSSSPTTVRNSSNSFPSSMTPTTSTSTSTSNSNLSLLLNTNFNNLTLKGGSNPSSSTTSSTSPLDSYSPSNHHQQQSHSSRSSIEAHSSPQSFNKALNRPDPSSNLLPPIAQPFFGENKPPPPPSSPIPPLTSRPTSRERTPELEEESSEEEMEGEEGANEMKEEVRDRDRDGVTSTRNGMDGSKSSDHHGINGSTDSAPRVDSDSASDTHHQRQPSNSSIAKLVHPIPILATRAHQQPQLHHHHLTSTSTSTPTPTASVSVPASTIPGQSQTSIESSSSLPMPDSIGERKHRLASLAPLVFHLAFSHQDELSLDILRNQIKEIGDQVIELVRPSLTSLFGSNSGSHNGNGHAKGNGIDYTSLLPRPQSSVLCLGGSLLGVAKYRNLLVEYLESKEIRFARVEFVNDPSKSGACALAGMWRDREVEDC